MLLRKLDRVNVPSCASCIEEPLAVAAISLAEKAAKPILIRLLEASQTAAIFRLLNLSQ